MPTFIKTGFWEKGQKGYKEWLNLDNLISGSIGTGTPGQVAFWEASGLSGSNNLYWNNTSGRLGIGLTTPLVKLHVYDNSVGDSVYVENTGGIPSIQTYYRNNNVNPTAGSNIGALLFATYFNSTYSPPAQEIAGIYGVYLGNGTNRIGGLDFRTHDGSGMQLRIRVNNVGNVMIGGTFIDGGQKLQVVGTASIQGLLSSYGADFFVAQSAGAGADYFHVDNDPNLSAGANNQLIALLRLRDRGTNGAFTGVNRLGIAMEVSAGGAIPFQLFSESGNIRIGYTTVVSTSTKLSIRGLTNDSTTLTINATANDDSSTLRAFNSNQVIIGPGGTLSASAALQVESTTRGFLPPRMTTTQRTGIVTPAAGLVVYDTTDNRHYGYNGSTWNAFY